MQAGGMGLACQRRPPASLEARDALERQVDRLGSEAPESCLPLLAIPYILPGGVPVPGTEPV